MENSKKSQIKLLLSFTILLLILIGVLLSKNKAQIIKDPIKVGILHSLSGSMAQSGSSVAYATLFAIRQLNENGGLIDRRIEPILVDGKSNWDYCAKEAERLITKEKVNAIFGCWTSACRKALLPIIEKHNALLFYPLQYEGMEKSKNIFYTGNTPNQQLLPSLNWMIQKYGNNIYVVGSDYIYPKLANEIIKDYAKAKSANVIAEKFVKLTELNIENIIEDIKKKEPSFIINLINGNVNTNFFKSLYNAGITSEKIPVISYSLDERDARKIGVKYLKGNFFSWSYFHDLQTEENKKFIASFRKIYGENAIMTDPMESAYNSVQIWASAVKESKSINVNHIKRHISHMDYAAPQGVVFMETDNKNLWKKSRIAQMQSEGNLKIVWESRYHLMPISYLPSRTTEEWNALQHKIFQQWQGHWEPVYGDAQ